jgi:hypothetical protein
MSYYIHVVSQLDLLNYAIQHSYTYNRWRKAATFMIRKDSNSSKIHRLRVIHLYEAGLNLLLGVKWRSLIHHCTDNSLLNAGQFGGLPGRDAMTPVFLEELQWETTRASRRSLLRMDFDASSCYDRYHQPSCQKFRTTQGCVLHSRYISPASKIRPEDKAWSPIASCIPSTAQDKASQTVPLFGF